MNVTSLYCDPSEQPADHVTPFLTTVFAHLVGSASEIAYYILKTDEDSLIRPVIGPVILSAATAYAAGGSPPIAAASKLSTWIWFDDQSLVRQFVVNPSVTTIALSAMAQLYSHF